jgi:putative nucleotidyltransferase with HDIG domain
VNKMAVANGKCAVAPSLGERDAERTARVLVVDDEPAAVKLLTVILASAGYACTAAHDGAEAIGALERGAFDAVVSDLQMPGMSGLDLLHHIRSNHSHTAFLVITGVDDVDVGVDAMRRGADDYLLKPLRESVVLAGLERALHKQRLERQVADYQRHLEEMVSERTRQLRSALQRVESSYEETLQALGAAIDLRDSETAGHCERVCRYSLEIARSVQYPDESIASLIRGAYLHDIGKLGIPDRILLKPGPLTDEERSLMQRHVEIGFNLVKNIAFLADAAGIVLMHHERFDGRGYPNGIKGKEILAGARIFAVADTLDAITSDRPYHRAAPLEVARQTIGRMAGTSFDPAVVEAFLAIPEEALLQTGPNAAV